MHPDNPGPCTLVVHEDQSYSDDVARHLYFASQTKGEAQTGKVKRAISAWSKAE